MRLGTVRVNRMAIFETVSKRIAQMCRKSIVMNSNRTEFLFLDLI